MITIELTSTGILWLFAVLCGCAVVVAFISEQRVLTMLCLGGWVMSLLAVLVVAVLEA